MLISSLSVTCPLVCKWLHTMTQKVFHKWKIEEKISVYAHDMQPPTNTCTSHFIDFQDSVKNRLSLVTVYKKVIAKDEEHAQAHTAAVLVQEKYENM